MKLTTQSGVSITSTSPSSILREQLKTHEADYPLYVERLPEALQAKKDLEAEDFPDPKSIDAADERYRIWLLHIEGYTLLVDLCDKIDENPFPGMRLTVTNVAVKLSPEVGRSRWGNIFVLYGIDASWRLYFPVVSDEMNIEDLERQLLQLAGERDSVPVCETSEVLPWGPNCKTYRTAKSALEGRGWTWRNVKREGKQSKVIFVPSGYRVLAEISTSATPVESG